MFQIRVSVKFTNGLIKKKKKKKLLPFLTFPLNLHFSETIEIHLHEIILVIMMALCSVGAVYFKLKMSLLRNKEVFVF